MAFIEELFDLLAEHAPTLEEQGVLAMGLFDFLVELLLYWPVAGFVPEEYLLLALVSTAPFTGFFAVFFAAFFPDLFFVLVTRPVLNAVLGAGATPVPLLSRATATSL